MSTKRKFPRILIPTHYLYVIYFGLLCCRYFASVEGLEHGEFSEDPIVQSLRHYEIVRPEVLGHDRSRRSIPRSLTSTTEALTGSLSFSLRAFGRDFTLDVSQNRGLLADGFVERFVGRNGTEERKSKDGDHCFYQGVVRGLEGSSVALSTCDGVDGLFFDGTESFYIEPLKSHRSKADGKHVVYRVKDVIVKKPHRCSLHNHSHSVEDHLDDVMASHSAHHRSRRNVYTETKYVEMIIVNDVKQYSYFKDKTATVLRAKKIANLVDSIYRPLNVRIALIMVETWTDKDQIDVVKDSSHCLDNFLKYRESTLSKKYKCDNAQLLTRQDFDGATVGKAQVDVICTMRSGGVVQDHSNNAAVTAATLAHELGHNFNMAHDELIKDCQCNAPKERGCLMESVGRTEAARDFSSCSIDSLKGTIRRGRAACLFNLPKQLYGDPVCGNAFKEEGEECDCGTEEECLKNGITCCNATTCKLHAHAQCSDGICCENCQFKKQGTQCREKIGVCDLPEYCTGTSEICPPNVFLEDGFPCRKGRAYCYEGECVSHDMQCYELWGSGAYNADERCYTVFNQQGGIAGFCYSSTGEQIKCEKEDVLCGKLQCQGAKHNYPVIGTSRKYSARSLGGGITCISGSAYLGEDIPDPGVTKEGTKCGDGKICLDGKCKNLSVIKPPSRSCPTNCSGNGVCNSQGNCHCDAGWRCPLCTSPGIGGSIDSGQGCYTVSAVVPEDEPSVNVAAAVILPFFFIGLILLAYFGYKHRRQIGEKVNTFWAKQHDTEILERSSGQRAAPLRQKPAISAPVRPRSQPYLTVPVNPPADPGLKPVRSAPMRPISGQDGGLVLKPVVQLKPTNKNTIMRNESSSSTTSTSSTRPLIKPLSRNSSAASNVDERPRPQRPPPARPVGRSASSACALDLDRQANRSRPVGRSASTTSYDKPKRPPPPPPPGSRASTASTGSTGSADKPSAPPRPPSLESSRHSAGQALMPPKALPHLSKPARPGKTVSPLAKPTPRPWETSVPSDSAKPISSVLRNTPLKPRTASLDTPSNQTEPAAKQRFSTPNTLQKPAPTPRKALIPPSSTGTTSSSEPQSIKPSDIVKSGGRHSFGSVL